MFWKAVTNVCNAITTRLTITLGSDPYGISKIQNISGTHAMYRKHTFCDLFITWQLEGSSRMLNTPAGRWSIILARLTYFRDICFPYQGLLRRFLTQCLKGNIMCLRGFAQYRPAGSPRGFPQWVPDQRFR